MPLTLSDQDRTKILVNLIGLMLEKAGADRFDCTLAELDEFSREKQPCAQIIDGQRIVAKCEPRAVVLAFGTILGLVKRANG